MKLDHHLIIASVGDRDPRLVHFSRAEAGHFWRALKIWPVTEGVVSWSLVIPVEMGPLLSGGDSCPRRSSAATLHGALERQRALVEH
jgi:hypothetical protein